MLYLLVHSSPDQVKIDVEVVELPGDQDAQVGGKIYPISFGDLLLFC